MTNLTGDGVNQVSEAHIQKTLVETPEAQRLLRQRAFQRVIIALGLVAALGLFLLWLPVTSRNLLVSSLFANRLLIALMSVFGWLRFHCCGPRANALMCGYLLR